jgi:hypothetical protein
MPSTNETPRARSFGSGSQRKAGRPRQDRRIRIEPERLDRVDHQRLARALLRLAQGEYDTPRASHAKARLPRSSPSKAPVGGHEPDTGPRPRPAGYSGEEPPKAVDGGAGAERP